MTDEKLMEELKEATRGLLQMSEADYPFEVFKLEGEPTPDALRALSGEGEGAAVETVTPAQFFRAATSEPDWKGADERATAKRFQALVRLLEANLADLKVYRVGSVNMPVFVAGRSASGAWLGVSTRVVET
jgi:hypothetical protein